MYVFTWIDDGDEDVEEGGTGLCSDVESEGLADFQQLCTKPAENHPTAQSEDASTQNDSDIVQTQGMVEHPSTNWVDRPLYSFFLLVMM